MALQAGTIEANRWLFIRLPSENHKIIQLVPHTLIHLGKFGSFDADALIGEKFGYTYDIKPDKTVAPVQPQEFSTEDDVEEQTLAGDKIEFLGVNTLSMEEIETLKKQGLQGEQIIEKITQAHQDFSKKTEFSKEKYLKRKKAKYLQQFTPEPITSAHLLDIYIDKEASKVMNMGVESLALVLSLANVKPGGHYLIVDETPSVIVTAVLERLGGLGSVTLAHENEHPNLDGLKYFPGWMPHENDLEKEPLVRLTNLLDLLCQDEAPEFVEKDLSTLKSSLKPAYYRQMYRERQRQWIVERGEIGYDGLIIATTLEPGDLLPRLLPFVAGSAPVVVFSEFKERLVDLTLALKDDLRVLAPTIVETRVRKYQTLPGRMHPMMTSRAYAGYILHGIRVYPSDQVQARGLGFNRKRRKLDEGLQTPESSETQDSS